MASNNEISDDDIATLEATFLLDRQFITFVANCGSGNLESLKLVISEIIKDEAVLSDIWNLMSEEGENVFVPEEFRNLARLHDTKKKEYEYKASTYQSRGLCDVVSFCLVMAQRHSFLSENANVSAANLILNSHAKRLQREDILDLHGLYLREALQALEIFLGWNIAMLGVRVQRSKDLFVITGRGKHSPNGVPVLKNAVLSWLHVRQIDVELDLLNPGIIKVRITKEMSNWCR